MEIFLFPGRSKMNAWSREHKTCILSLNSGNHVYSDGESLSSKRGVSPSSYDFSSEKALSCIVFIKSPDL
jgi:hypothetical protein